MTEGYCGSEMDRGELPEVNHQSETERNNNRVNSIRPKSMASPHSQGEALTEPAPAAAGLRKERQNGMHHRSNKADRPEKRSVMIDTVIGVGMMRSVCEISRETLLGQKRCSCSDAEEPARRESEHP